MQEAKDNNEWFCVSLYEISGVTPENLKRIVDSLFEIAGAEVNSLTVLRKNKDISSKLEALVPYLESGLESSQNIGFSASDGDTVAVPKTFKVGYFRHAELGISDITICFAKKDLEQHLKLFLSAILGLVSCDYGIGITKPWSLRPDLLVSGFPLGHDSPEQVKLGGLIWSERYKFDRAARRPLRRYSEGYIFDCFELNILSAAHLDRIVGGSAVRVILGDCDIEVINIKENHIVMLNHKEIEQLRLILKPIILL